MPAKEFLTLMSAYLIHLQDENSTLISVAALGLCVFLAGCTTDEEMKQEVQAARTRSYQQWQRDRDRENQTETHISGKLNMADTVRLALTNNKALLAVVEEKEIAKGKITESYSQLLPTLSAYTDYTHLDKPETLSLNGNQLVLGARDNYSYGLQVIQPLFRGGATIAAMRAARLFSYFTDEHVLAQTQQTIYEVSKAYYDTLLAQELYKVNEEAVKSAEAHLADVNRKKAEGVVTKLDVLRAQVDVSLFRAEMIQQHNRINLAKTRLLKVMGVSQNSEITLSDSLEYHPFKPVLEEAVKLALEKRPDLYMAELNIRLQQEALVIAKSTYWPQLNGVFTQGWAKPNPHNPLVNDWGYAWSTGVQLSYPIFDGFGREGRVTQAKAAIKQQNYNMADTQERALLEIQQAVLSIRDAEEFVESQKLNLDAAAEALRLAEVGYREGVNTEVDVIDARSALTRTQGLYYQALYDHTTSRLDLEHAMGILGPQK
jgi:outer membrane protein